MSIRLLIKNGLLLSLAPFLPKIIAIMLLPLITKYLTDVDFGIAATISAYSNAISAFSLLGLTVVLQNSFFKHPNYYKYVWRQIYGFLKIWMIIFAAFQSMLLYFIIPAEAIENKWNIILLSIFSNVLFGPTAAIGTAYYINTKQSIPIVWRSIFSSIITILTSFVLIYFLRLGYMGWYVSSFLGTFFSNATFWFVVNKKLNLKPIYKFKYKTIREYLTVSIPTIPHYYSIYLLESSGRMVLDQNNVSQSEIGRLSIVQQFGDMFQTGMMGLNNAISPYIMQSLKDNKQHFIRKITLVFVTLIFSLAFILAIWSKEIFNILISNYSLKSSYEYFIVYIMALCYRPMYNIVSTYYFFYEETKKLLFISFLSGVLAFISYLIFVPKLGVWAVLIGYYLANLYFGYSGYFFRVYIKNTSMKLPVPLIMVIQFILTACALFLVNYIIIKTIVTIIIVLVLLIIVYKYRYVFKG